MNKPFKTVDEQIEILENRNIVVGNKRFARQILTYENYYYVINGYKTPFINSTNNGDAYKPGTSFNEIVALYSFDRKLRDVLPSEMIQCNDRCKAAIPLGIWAFGRWLPLGGLLFCPEVGGNRAARVHTLLTMNTLLTIA